MPLFSDYYKTPSTAGETKVRVPEPGKEGVDVLKLASEEGKVAYDKARAEGKSEVEANEARREAEAQATQIIGRYGDPGATMGYAREALKDVGESIQSVVGEDTALGRVVGSFTQPTVVNRGPEPLQRREGEPKPSSEMGLFERMGQALTTPIEQPKSVVGQVLTGPTEPVVPRAPTGASAKELAKAALKTTGPVPEDERAIRERAAAIDERFGAIAKWEAEEKEKIAAASRAGTINPLQRTAQWSAVDKEVKRRKEEASKEIAGYSPSTIRELSTLGKEIVKVNPVFPWSPLNPVGAAYRAATGESVTEDTVEGLSRVVESAKKVPGTAVEEAKTFAQDVRTEAETVAPIPQEPGVKATVRKAMPSVFIPTASVGAGLKRLGAAMTSGEVITEGPEKGTMVATAPYELSRAANAAAGLFQAAASRSAERSGLGATSTERTTTQTPAQMALSQLPVVGEAFEVQEPYQQGESPLKTAGRLVNFMSGNVDVTQLAQDEYWRDYARAMSDNLGFYDVRSQILQGTEIDPRSPLAIGITGAALVGDVALPMDEAVGGGVFGVARRATQGYKGARTAADLGGTAKEVVKTGLQAATAEPLRAFGTPLPGVRGYGDVQDVVLARQEEIIGKRAAETGQVELPARMEDRARQILNQVAPQMSYEDIHDHFVARMRQDEPPSQGAQQLVSDLQASGVRLDTPADVHAAQVLADAMARGWASMGEGRTPDQFFAERIAGVTTEAPGMDALRQGDIQTQGLAPIFYSPLKKRVGEVFDKWGSKKPMPADALLARVKVGVKQDELDWTGFEDWLKDRKEPVTREEAEKWAEQGQVRIEEVQKGEGTFSREAFDEAHKAYQKEAKDAKDARDAALKPIVDRITSGQVPRNPEDPRFIETQAEARRVEDEYNQRLEAAKNRRDETIRELQAKEVKWSAYRIPGPSKNYRELVATLPRDMTQEPYKSVHWGDIENPLFHIRMTDRVDAAGNRVLFIDEVQSDWLQALKTKEAKDAEWFRLYDEKKALETEKRAKEAKAMQRFQGGEDDRLQQARRWLIQNDDAYDALGRQISDVDYQLSQIQIPRPIPPAPFLDTWHELAVKRILRYAAENGYDRVAFTTGDAIQGVVGGELAGQRAFYDQKIPGTLNKLGKKWGARVEPVRIVGDDLWDASTESKIRNEDAERYLSFPEEERKDGSKAFDEFVNEIDEKYDIGGYGATLDEFDLFFESKRNQYPSLPITDRMKQSVLHEGQALFQGGRGTFDPNDPRVLFQGPTTPEVAARAESVAPGISRLREAMVSAAARDTAFDPARYAANKSKDALAEHCKAVARVVQEKYGGEILTGKVEGQTHFWNRLADGSEVDLTSAQFGGNGFDPVATGGKVAKEAKTVNPRFKTFEERVAKLAQPGTYAGDAPRAAVTFLDDGRAIIHALENPDLSSVAHELFHVVERDMPPDMRKDLVAWAKKEGHAVDIDAAGNMVGDADAVRGAKELGARGFETYLSTGKAPTARLAEVFEAMRRWLASVYYSIVGSDLDVKIPPKMQKVYDRVLGVDTAELEREAKIRTSKTAPRKGAIKEFWSKEAVDPKTGESRHSSVFGKVRRYEAHRVPIENADLARELGVELGAKVDPGELYAAVLQKVLADDNRRMFPVPLVKISPRSVVPESRIGSINQRVASRVATLFGATPEEIGKTIRKGELNGETINYFPMDDEGRTLTIARRLMESHGLETDIPARLRDPNANLTYVTPEEYTAIVTAIVDIEAGFGTTRNRVVESLPTAFFDTVVDGLFGKPKWDLGGNELSPLTPKVEPVEKPIPANPLISLVKAGPKPISAERGNPLLRAFSTNQPGPIRGQVGTTLHGMETLFTREDFFERQDPRQAAEVESWMRTIARTPTQTLEKMKRMKTELFKREHPVLGRVPGVAGAVPRKSLLMDYFATIAPPIGADVKKVIGTKTTREANDAVFPAFSALPDTDIDLTAAKDKSVGTGTRDVEADWRTARIRAMYDKTKAGGPRTEYLDQVETFILQNEPTDYEIRAMERLRAGVGDDNDATYMIRGLLERRQPVLTRGRQILKAFTGKGAEGFGNFKTEDFLEAYSRFYAGDIVGVENMARPFGTVVERNAALTELLVVTELDQRIHDFCAWMRQEKLWADGETMWKDMLARRASQPNTLKREMRFEEHLRSLGLKDDEIEDAFKAYQAETKGTSAAINSKGYRDLVRRADAEEIEIRNYQHDARRLVEKYEAQLPDLEAMANEDPRLVLTDRIEVLRNRVDEYAARMEAARGKNPPPDPAKALADKVDATRRRLIHIQEMQAKLHAEFPDQFRKQHPEDTKLQRELQRLLLDPKVREQWMERWKRDPANQIGDDGDLAAYSKAKARWEEAQRDYNTIAGDRSGSQQKFMDTWKARVEKAVADKKARIAELRRAADNDVIAMRQWAARRKRTNPGEPNMVILHRMSHDIAKRYPTAEAMRGAIAKVKAELQAAGVDPSFFRGPPPALTDLDKFEHRVIESMQDYVSGKLGFMGTIQNGHAIRDPKFIVDPEAYNEALYQLQKWGISPSAKDTEKPQPFRSPQGKKTWLPTSAKQGVEKTIEQTVPVGRQFSSKSGVEKLLNDWAGINFSGPRAFGYAWSWVKTGYTSGVFYLGHPAYIVGQVIGSAFQCHLAMGGPGTFRMMGRGMVNTPFVAETIRQVSKEMPEVVSQRYIVAKNGAIYTPDMVADLALRGGLDTSQVKSDFYRLFGDDLKRQMEKTAFFRDAALGGWWRRMITEFSNSVDTVFRTSILVDALKEGKSAEEGIQLAQLAILDYANLSDKEKSIFRNAFIFYAYRRRNFALVWDTLLKNPGRLARVIRLQRDLAKASYDDNWEMLSQDFTGGRMGLPYFGRGPDGKARMDWMNRTMDLNYMGVKYFGPAVAHTDAMNLLANFLALPNPEAKKELVLSASPFANFIYSEITEKELQTGQDLYGYRSYRVPEWFLVWDEAFASGAFRRHFDVTKTSNVAMNLPGYPQRQEFYVVGDKKRDDWLFFTNMLAAGRTLNDYSFLDRSNFPGFMDLPRATVETRRRLFGEREDESFWSAGAAPGGLANEWYALVMQEGADPREGVGAGGELAGFFNFKPYYISQPETIQQSQIKAIDDALNAKAKEREKLQALPK